ncbi:MAG: RidA family protein [Gemmatimonadetes bacterium]|nr:RidA family protein [Gemmatimonadota bacterium]
MGVVNGILNVKLSAQKSPYRIRFVDVWAQRGARWQLIAFQATRLPDAAPAGGASTAAGPQASATGRVRRINPAGLSTPTGYSHVVVEADGRTVHIAGQVALDSTGTVVGAGDFKAQAERVYENLRIALASVGATFSDLVKTNTYVTDMRNVAVLREVRGRYYDAANLPVSTAVQVAALARADWLIEIEATALLRQPLPDR